MSSNDLAVSARGLSKSYLISHNSNRPTTLREAIVERAKHPFGVNGQKRETFWALSDVDFDIRQGESVGIIGRNGAGKSTLLKILSRITYPTRGVVDIYGRVASLLEVGTGFHGELTGRENIALNGSILGMSRREIKDKFDEIVAFAEVENFLDTPVKRYSSGMYVRLAFAVAAHLEPEILIIDEVLAVGDAKFQKKCLAKLDDVKREGRTVLVVSHQMQVIHATCKRAILLERGRIKKIGDTAHVVATYLGSSGEHADLRHFNQAGTGEAKFLELRVTTDSSTRPSEVIRGEILRIELSVLVKKELPESNVSMALRDSTGLELFSHCWADQYTDLPTLPPGMHLITLEVPTRYLRPGPYWLTLCAGRNEADVVAEVRGIELPPVVLEPTANLVLESRRWGVIYVECKWSHQYDGTHAENRQNGTAQNLESCI